MHHLKHQHFKPPRKLKLSDNYCHLIYFGLVILFSFICLIDCKAFNEQLTNFNNLTENFKYDPATIYSGGNSITSIELLKNSVNGIQEANCGCPPKGQYSSSNLVSDDLPCAFRLNTEIKYACKSGHTKVSGSDSLTCIMNNGKAEWNGKPLNCKKITCSDPGEVAHATRKVDDPNFSFNSQVSYQCHPNYMSDSKPVILCNQYGQWNRKKPICKLIQCPHLSDPNLFIQYTDPDRKVNSTANFKCATGYHFEDKETASRRCEWNGNWSGSNPMCVENYCELSENLSPDLIVTPLQDRYNVNDKINYKCKSSKKILTAECKIDGNFSMPLPIDCPKPKKTHCPPVELQHGQVNSSEQDLKNEFAIGVRLTFQCDEHYVLNEPNKVLHCDFNGEWSSNLPRCLDLATIRTSQILSYILTCIIIILVLIITITVVLLFRWRQKQLQKRQWQRYFCNLEYPHCDKTKVQTNSSQEMHIFQAQRISVPFTDL